MIRLLKWIAAHALENIGWKLLSLAVAVAIWAFVASEPELSTFATSQVEYKNLPDDVEISSSPLSSVMLELRGPSGELREIGPSGWRPQVVLDMAGAAPGQRTFAMDSGAVRLPRGVRLVRAVPSQARFEFERSAREKVPVAVQIVGAGHDGYVLARDVAQPAEVWIAGPATRVARVKSAQTDPVDVSSVVGTSQFRVNAFVEDPYVRLESSPQIDVTVTMKKR